MLLLWMSHQERMFYSSASRNQPSSISQGCHVGRMGVVSGDGGGVIPEPTRDGCDMPANHRRRHGATLPTNIRFDSSISSSSHRRYRNLCRIFLSSCCLCRFFLVLPVTTFYIIMRDEAGSSLFEWGNRRFEISHRCDSVMSLFCIAPSFHLFILVYHMNIHIAVCI
jgi:hypothetical protein